LERKIGFGLILLLLVSCTPQVVKPVCTLPSVVFDNGDCFSVELATTIEQQMNGLMNRESMESDRGMLFVFQEVQPRRFWMKNTLIPLDMVFMDENMVAVDVKHDVQPCKKDPCPLYYGGYAQYVLELNGGVTRSRGIDLGSVMILSE